jgi:hypothetical protein
MKLRRTVTVGGKTYLRGTTPPAAIAEQITNPGAWDGADLEATSAGDATSSPADDQPPRSGRGSGKDAWAAFAAGKVDVAEDAPAKDIIAALEAAGVIAPEEG